MSKRTKKRARLERRIQAWEEMYSRAGNKDAFMRAFKKPGSLKK